MVLTPSLSKASNDRTAGSCYSSKVIPQESKIRKMVVLIPYAVYIIVSMFIIPKNQQASKIGKMVVLIPYAGNIIVSMFIVIPKATSSKIGQMVVLITYAVNIIVSMFIVIPKATSVSKIGKMVVLIPYAVNVIVSMFIVILKQQLSKMGQMVVLIPYAVNIIVSMFIVIPKAKNWVMRHKWHQWVSLLDADQDGIISSDDMKKTNATLEQLRPAVGDRRTALNADAQKKWWDDHIFKEESTNTSLLKTMSLIWREFIIPEIWGTKCALLSPAFNFFSTPDFGKRIAF
ncbi:unnamed protein product [Mytilus edulis]|uniref:EF-hand domain-containing protein n=1 Tax=Mytilus edulis TaxID=6550 RepID=A0A8S3RU72_MYTED|nr:unnamed protein product [Mytilus edulis]